MHNRILSIPGFYSLDTSCMPPFPHPNNNNQIAADISSVPWRGQKSHLVGSHWCSWVSLSYKYSEAVQLIGVIPVDPCSPTSYSAVLHLWIKSIP